MSKSTPINQIPQQFVNEPQRQMITQAQQAAQHFTMPQSSQLAPDVIPENDNSIQDMLNELNGMGSIPADVPTQMPSPMLQMPPTRPMVLTDHDMMIPPPTTTTTMQTLFEWNNDLKMIVIAMCLFVFVSLVPIEVYVSKYISLSHIPYYNILIKAVVFGAILLIASKLS